MSGAAVNSDLTIPLTGKAHSLAIAIARGINDKITTRPQNQKTTFFPDRANRENPKRVYAILATPLMAAIIKHHLKKHVFETSI